ncbi:MAG TPA: hypothetical protein VM101_12540 [Flavitalea sp.]|nr:hypothetical protein [Flavitalea sp.]
MTIEQFQQLTEMEKLCAIMETGRLMAQKLEPSKRIFLYRLESFFVSACYSNTEDQLTDVIAFTDVEESTPHFRKFLISIHPAERCYDTPSI